MEEGTVAVRAGEETIVTYPKPFQSPPLLSVPKFNQSWFKEQPYNLGHFEIVSQTATGFTIRNNHREQNIGSWAEVCWKATGTRAVKKPIAEMTRQERIIDAVEKLGGHTETDAKLPGSPIIAIDLHRTRVKDADLEMLHGLTSLRKLNLYGTPITDAGLSHLSGLSGLEKLYLNATAITDAGLEHLHGLSGLKELSLFGTRITDAGLAHLSGLTTLQSLTLGGTQLTDLGLEHLKSLRELRHLSVSGTSITLAGTQRWQRVLPKLQVVR